MNVSMVMSILKVQYGWNGCFAAGKGEIASEILQKHICESCAAKECAAFIYDECGPNYFMKRFDGKPNWRSVERDRAGSESCALH
jgi:hypothetical protein